MALKRIGIFGPTECGKSTLANRLVQEFFQNYKVKSLILDPNIHEHSFWFAPAVGFITGNEQAFWSVVWASKNCNVVVEEASTMIQREKNLIPVFTRLRHCKHNLIVIGHSGMDLLPVMREQINQLYLFRQPMSAAKVWAEVMTEQGLLRSVELKQYEFLSHKLFSSPVKMILPRPSPAV